MTSGALAGEHGGHEEALIDLEAVLVALQASFLGGDLLRGRHQRRHDAGGPRHQLLDPHEARPPDRERVVDRVGMPAQETHAGVARRVLDHLGGRLLALLAVCLRWQPPQEARRLEPVAGIAAAVCGKIRGAVRQRALPIPNIVAGQAGRRQAVGCGRNGLG